MEINKSLQLYLRERINTIGNLLRSAESFTIEDFHKLRVEIKKLKAFFKLIGYFNRTFEKKRLFKPLKSIFKAAGKIREFQLEERILVKYEGLKRLEAYRADLRESVLTAKMGFLGMVNLRTRKKIKELPEKLRPYLALIQNRDVSLYLKKENGKLKKEASHKKLRSTQIHKARKRLKSIFYNQQIADTPGIIKKPAKSFQKLLGDWHDLAVVSCHLKESIQNDRKNESEARQIKKLIEKLSANHKLLRKKIDNRFHSEIS